MAAERSDRPPIAAIVAVARNGIIGRDGGLPWRLSEDLRFFRRQTLGKPIVMGRRTFASIGKALPGRFNLVVTRDPTFAAPGVVRVGSPEEALRTAADARPDAAEIMVIGGSQIYEPTLPAIHRLYLTEIDADVEGDTVFPAFERSEWSELCSEPGSPAEGGPGFRFVILERRA